jgi:hypothetical protein
MAFSQPEQCETIGIIHDDSSRHSPHRKQRPLMKPAPLPRCEISHRDAQTDMDWITDPEYLQTGCIISNDLNSYPDAQQQANRRPVLQRAYTLFEPEHLCSIEPYVNRVSGRFGLKALRFSGTRQMGTTLLGDWQSQYATASQRQAMHINGVYPKNILM